MKKILISTGGSGGHVIPALTMYDHISEKFDVVIASDQRGLRFIDQNKYETLLLDIPNIKKSILKFPINVVKFIFSTFSAFKFLKKNKIEILISTGGYMSLPFCLASVLNKNKIILFEPNKVLGRSNKLVLKFSKKIICYYNDLINFPSRHQKKIFIIDFLLRKNIYKLEKKSLDIKNKLNLLVLGGSQGSIFFDKIIFSVVKNFDKDYKINLFQQISDKKNMKLLEDSYKKLNINFSLFDFKQNIEQQYLRSNIVITRCGASALSEISYANIPFIAVPFPYAKDNHQFLNAKHFSDLNCCWLFEQNNKTEIKIVDLLKKILKDENDYKTKEKNLSKISYQNNWNNINKKITKLLNEN